MRSRTFCQAAVFGLLLCAPQFGEAQSFNRTAEPVGKGTLWFIPHTHWEGAVFKTREEFLKMGLTNILKALTLLKQYPDYRFVLDQVAYVKPFLERYPEEEASFRKFVAEGRLQIVGGMDIMPDVNIPSGESFVRQALYGKRYYRAKLGVDVTVGWLLDTFGHHAQMPQILRQAGFKSYWFFRGVPNLEVPSEFLWEGIDGTQIPAFWLPYGYTLFHAAPANFAEFESFIREGYQGLGNHSGHPDRVGLAGADVSEPEEHVPALVQEFNRKSDAKLSIRFAVPTDFEQAVAQRGARPVIKGEFNPVFQGVYSSRIDIKQWIRELERTLTTAEKLHVIARWLGAAREDESLERAWEPVIFNQTHDLASGVMVDKVYEDTLRGYHFSKRLGDELIETSLEFLASKIDTRGEGIAIGVFNSLGWPRTDVAEAEIGFSDGGVLDIELLDPQGQSTPVQLLEAERYGNGGLRRAHIIFVARQVPALGYSLYRVLAKTSLQEPKRIQGRSGTDHYWRRWAGSVAHQDSGSIENEHYRATFNLWTGEMTSLRVKSSDWEALGGPANVVAREQDGGDFWELYGNLNGARNIAMKTPHPVPRPDKAQFSSEYVGGSGSVRSGPVFSEYQVSHPFGNGTFATKVRLFSGVSRLDISTQIINNDRFVRYRALFPTALKNGQSFHEIPFGSIQRPPMLEFPAQNWIDYGDSKKGIALLNRGLPGHNVADGTLMLSLLRSTRINAYSFHGGYEPGTSSDSGLEIGKEVILHYALMPHAGDWREAGVYRAGYEFNHPFITFKAASHAGVLPKQWGLLEVSHPSVVTSALKPGPDATAILRVYEATGRPASSVTIKVRAKVVSAHESDLMEATGQQLRVTDDTLRFDVGPYQIKTFQLKLQPVPQITQQRESSVAQ